MAKKQRAEQWAELRRQREEEDRRQRVMVITEFDAGDAEATMHAMADEILAAAALERILINRDCSAIAGRRKPRAADV